MRTSPTAARSAADVGPARNARLDRHQRGDHEVCGEQARHHVEFLEPDVQLRRGDAGAQECHHRHGGDEDEPCLSMQGAALRGAERDGPGEDGGEARHDVGEREDHSSTFTSG
jgi:hypothetical protein